MKKYELIDDGHPTLKRIRALIDIPSINVLAGDLGGLIETENNLSHKGTCWVFTGARVWGEDTRVSGGAQVSGEDTWVFNGAQVSGIGTRVSGGAQVSGEGARVSRTPIHLTGLLWPVLISDKHMRIGCQQHTFEKWQAFTDADISAMHGDAPTFWAENKTALLSLAANHESKVRS